MILVKLLIRNALDSVLLQYIKITLITNTGLTKQGITVDDDTPNNAKIMLLTSIVYFVVQGIAFAYVYDPTGNAAHRVERPFALAGFILCTTLLAAYCIYQVLVPKLAEKRLQSLEKERAEKF